ncbi:hypothetical protein SASPL_154223 [Salvia splendens]|uniref:CCHC-type domain-containing protein n=1 Tax=Salvia splendens TaxID=180675 RepID=A0A8X8VZS5_SALSN|nr:hypothetical protein SASPL_154223 [Salvia splendens]
MASNGSSMSATQPLIPVFKGEGYEYWSIRMQTLLKSQDLWDFVEQGYADPDEANRLRENKKKDSKALAIIQQAVHDNVFSRIATATTSKQAWISLQQEDEAGEISEQGDKSHIQCYNCGKHGHVKADCWSKEKEANYVQEEANDNKLFMAVANTVDVPNDVWFVDSGCSNHMCSNKEMFKELVESRKIQVRLGDDKSIQVEGKCTVVVKDGHGNTKLIYDVYFIPHLAHNLLSVGQLISTGYMVVFDDRFRVIKEKKSGQIIAKVCMMENIMFPLRMPNVEKYALVSGTQEASRLCHIRYGHLNTNGLKLLREKEAVATAIFLLNISPMKAVQNRTPYEAWGGTKLTVSHLRVFGCVAYALVSSQRRRKLDEKSVKCIFIGYSSQSKAYKLYIPLSGKVIISRDVVFHEDAGWDWESKQDDSYTLFPLDSTDADFGSFLVLEGERELEDGGGATAIVMMIRPLETGEGWDLISSPSSIDE